MDKTVRMNLLFDFYGQLLTERQRTLFSLYHQDDLSLGEIAEQFGVTRQAVYDILHRSEKTLTDLEKKLGLVQRYAAQRELLKEVQLQLNRLANLLAEEKVPGAARQQMATLQKLVSQLLDSF